MGFGGRVVGIGSDVHDSISSTGQVIADIIDESIIWER